MLFILNKIAPMEFYYAFIGLNTYLKMDKQHNIDGFYKEYEAYKSHTKEQEQTKINMMYKKMVMELS